MKVKAEIVLNNEYLHTPTNKLFKPLFESQDMIKHFGLKGFYVGIFIDLSGSYVADGKHLKIKE